MQFYDGLSIIRFWNIVENTGSQTQVLDYISSFNYEGIDKEGSLPADKNAANSHTAQRMAKRSQLENV